MLDIFITSRVRRKIIVVYTRYPHLKAHVRALAKLIKEDAGNVQRELRRLSASGFLKNEKLKNTTTYFLDENFLLLPDLKSMVEKIYNSRNNNNTKNLKQ